MRDDPGAKLVSAGVLLGWLAVALMLLILAREVWDMVDERIMHQMTSRFESEPKEGYDYWEGKLIRKELPSRIVIGGIWLAVFGFVLHQAWKRVRHILS